MLMKFFKLLDILQPLMFRCPAQQKNCCMPQSNSFAAHLDTSNVAICAGTSIQCLERGAG